MGIIPVVLIIWEYLTLVILHKQITLVILHKQVIKMKQFIWELVGDFELEFNLTALECEPTVCNPGTNEPIIE